MAGSVIDWLAAIEGEAALAPWLATKQEAARQQLQTLSGPNRKTELWRYADAQRLKQALPAATTAQAEVAENQAAADVVIELNNQGLQVHGDCPDWLQVTDISGIEPTAWQELLFDQETVVNLANTAYFNTGVRITVAPNADAENVQVALKYQFDDAGDWRFIRNHIELTAGAQLNLKEVHQSGRINVANVYAMAEGSELKRWHDVSLNDAQQSISFHQFELSGRNRVINMNRHYGGFVQHHNHVVNFNGEASEYRSGSINKGFNNSHITDIVKVNHNHKNNLSDVTHRSIASDQSQIFNNAKAVVAVGADQSEIEQDLKNILLSEDAKIYSKPELEVYADEVVAAHGSTIGALDEQSLFYLQSRGIDIQQARQIMIESFEQEAVIC